MKFSTTLRTARAQEIIDACGTNPKLKFYTGTESLAPAGTLLGTLNVTGDLGTASSGVIDFNETVTQTNSSHVAGTPSFVVFTTSADVAVWSLVIPGEMTFTGTIATGVNITWNPSTQTEAGA